MPHLRVEHSSNLARRVDLEAVVRRLRTAMEETGVFPVAGVRVRCIDTAPSAIADGHPDNAFAHLELRIGAGRDLETRRRAGGRVFAAARELFAAELEGGYFALSLEIVEIDGDTSWKANGIRARLAGAAG